MRVTSILFIGTAAIACSGEIARDSATSLVDTNTIATWTEARSAIGDTQVVRISNSASPSAELSLTRELQIGAAEGERNALFASIVSPVPTPNGGIVLFDSGDKKVKLFDSLGRFVHNVGRTGDGPGEYRSVSESGKIAVARDGTVFVLVDGQVLSFDVNGQYVGGFEFRGSAAGVEDAHILHILADLAPQGMSLADAANRRLLSPIVVRVSESGTPIDTSRAPEPTSERPVIKLKRKPAPQFVTALMPNLPSEVIIDVPLEPYFKTAYSPRGYWVSGAPGSYSIELHRAAQPPLRIAADLARVPSSDSERGELLQESLWRSSSVAETGGVELSVVPAEKPFFKSLFVDWDGLIWVELYQPGIRTAFDTIAHPELARSMRPKSLPAPSHVWREPTVYDIYSPDGNFLGRLRVPDGSSLIGSMGRKIWMKQRDSLGVSTMGRYSVTAQSGSPAVGYWQTRRP